MNEGLFHYDAVYLARAVENSFRTGHLEPAARGRYGSVLINSLIYLPFFILHQDADFSIRLSSVIFHALSITMLFLFVYELFGDFIQALFSGLLFSFVPFYFSPNTYGKEHGMSVFFVLLSFYLLCRWQRERSYFLLGLSGFFLGFSISVKESVIMLVPLYFFLLFTFLPKDRVKTKVFLAAFVPFFLVFLVLFFSYLKHEFFRELFIRDVFCSEFLGPCSYMLQKAFKDLTKSIPKLLFLFSVLGAILMVQRRRIPLVLFLCLWFMLIFFYGNMASFAPRYLDVVVIPMLILAAYFLSRLYEKSKIISTALLIYFVSGMLIFVYPTLSFRHRYNSEKQFALFVNQVTQKNALIITMDDAIFIEYYGKRKTLSHPVNDRAKMHDFVRAVSVSLANNIPVYVTGSGFSYDQKKFFWDIMTESYKLTLIGTQFCEDYHRPELEPVRYDHHLFRVNFLKP